MRPRWTHPDPVNLKCPLLSRTLVSPLHSLHADIPLDDVSPGQSGSRLSYQFMSSNTDANFATLVEGGGGGLKEATVQRKRKGGRGLDVYSEPCHHSGTSSID